jgi:hypothetical protein
VRATKQALIVCLLQRDGGANLEDLIATGWLPHATRAAPGTELRTSKDEAGRTICCIAPPPTAGKTRSRKAA